jgi:hypothetical protein
MHLIVTEMGYFTLKAGQAPKISSGGLHRNMKGFKGSSNEFARCYNKGK